MFIQLNNVEFTNPEIPTLQKDAILTNGSMMLFDYLNEETLPIGVNPEAGYQLKNMVTGGPPATVTYTSNPILYNGGLFLPGASTSGIDFGDNYDLTSLNPDFVMVLWIELVAGNYTTNAFRQLMGRGTTFSTAGAFQAAISSGSGGIRPNGYVSTDSFFRNVTGDLTNMTPGVGYQFAVSYVGNTVSFYRDGVRIGTDQTLPRTTAMGDVSTNKFTSSFNDWKGIFKRQYMENLSISGREAEDVVANDFLYNKLTLK